jgi:cellulose synthase/poly-beta-1,6-N-acetylglucosamine synthase-like glycosyltransferase
MYILIISCTLLLLGLLLFIIDAFILKSEEIPLIKNTKNRFCILIPARDESNVIENLIMSIESQSININMKDVYVIVEDKNDKTIDICKKHNVNFYIRKKLNLKSKGYALMEIIEYLYESNNIYDIYFIFDADNILDKDYFKEMLVCYENGYDIATGYRKSTNVNKNVISTCSALTFSLINNLLNKNKQSKNRSITISGTGYYISNKIINKFKSFPFHLLTEDYELSIYLSLEKYSTFYNTKAIFYDEQPLSFKESIKQRTRWCFGFLQVRKKYFKDILKQLNNKNVLGEFISITPYVLMLLSIILLYIYLILNITLYPIKYIKLMIILSLFIYFILILFTITLLYLDKNLNIKTSNKIKAILYNPIFILSYIYCITKALFSDVSWEKIEHNASKD